MMGRLRRGVLRRISRGLLMLRRRLGHSGWGRVRWAFDNVIDRVGVTIPKNVI